MRLKLCCAAVAAALIVTGCGDDSTSSGNGDQTVAARNTPTRTTEILHHVNKLPRPENPGPHPGAKIDQLVVRDIRKGIGPAIQSGDTGLFDFIATDWVTGRPLDSSWRRRRVFETQIEKGVVIDGWWQGIPGMRVGGRRQITVPPALGFTQTLVPGLEKATTYFDVVLVEIRSQQPRAMTPATPAPAGG
jgi:peptidylprolyl isomerase